MSRKLILRSGAPTSVLTFTSPYPVVGGFIEIPSLGLPPTQLDNSMPSGIVTAFDSPVRLTVGYTTAPGFSPIVWFISSQRERELLHVSTMEDVSPAAPYNFKSSLNIISSPSSPVRNLTLLSGEVLKVYDARWHFTANLTTVEPGIYPYTIYWTGDTSSIEGDTAEDGILEIVAKPFSTGLTSQDLVELYPELAPGPLAPLRGCIDRAFRALSLRLRADVRSNPALPDATEHDVDGHGFFLAHASYAYTTAVQATDPERAQAELENADRYYNDALRTALLGLVPRQTYVLATQYVRPAPGGHW